MKKVFLIILVILFNYVSYSQGYLKHQLEDVINVSDDGQLYPVLIKLSKQVDLDLLKQDLLKKNIGLKERRKEIVSALDRNNNIKNDFDFLIENLQDEYPLQIQDIKKFWAVNALSCKASSSMIREMVQSVDVEYIQYDFPVVGEKVRESSGGNKSIVELGVAEPGLIAINARGLWALGYTGRNRIAMNIDSGVSAEHPTLKDRFLGHYLPLSQTWLGFETAYPYDIDQSHFHGTHTMGTMIGLDTATADTIGVAFNAFWIASDPIVSDLADVRPLSDYFIAFEWALNPDGNINTTSDIPDVINNSWGVDYNYWANTWKENCAPIELDFISALEAVDCAVIFSAGNEGPDDRTSGMPAALLMDSLNVFSVGAIDAESVDFNIASFSSRGPSDCNLVDPIGIKPEVSAPGVDVRSASGSNDYRVLSGTSMASPHVSGAILLLREAFPNVTSTVLKNALYKSAIDLGDAGEDNVYGRGIIDVYAAYEYLSQTYTPTAPVTNQFDIAVDSLIGPDKLTCELTNTYSVIIKNKGTDALSNFVFRLVLNSDTIESVLNITLQANETYTIPITIDLVDATNEINFEIEKLGVEEFNIYNNYKNIIVTRLLPNSIPFYEDFENLGLSLENSNFYVSNPDYGYTWAVDSTEGISGSYKSLNMHFHNYLPREDQLDFLLTGRFDIPSTGNTYMYFKHSYTQRFNTKKDSLIILISNACNMSSPDTIYINGGAGMKTRSSNSSTSYTPTLSEEWVDNSINLTAYAGESVYFEFITINKASNNLYIDELRVENGLDLSLNSKKKHLVVLFPNPTSGELFFKKLPEGELISIYDLKGQKVFSKTVSNHKVNISQLENGIYFIRSKEQVLGKIVLQK